MDRDPIAVAQGMKRVCWTNTGNMTNGGGSAVETAANYGELLCLEDEPDDSATTEAVPFVTRFFNGHPQLAMPDNIAFQPHTGRLVVLEDGPVEVLYADGSLRELRGNDIWMCLPDGADNDVLSDGCVRIASLRDTDSEPTGFIFDASGERAFVNLQHRATGQGAVLMISGFKVAK
jgi:secreted PhoX family phosphatase